MPATPNNPYAESSAPQTRFIVRVGPPDGSAPGPEDEVDWLRFLDAEQTSGGGRLDAARFAYDLGRRGERVQETQTPTGFSRRVEVFAAPDPGWIRDDEGAAEETRVPLFAGDLDLQSIEIGDGVETVFVTARVQPYHFGDELRGPEVWDPITESVVTLDEHLEFNPLIDGTIEANGSNGRKEGTDRHLWVDPESCRTEESRQYQEEGKDPLYWDLREAIRSLCGLLNPDEEFVRNPELGPEDEENPLFADAPRPENIVLKRGAYLPDCLDALLTPFGYAWHVAVVDGEPDEDGRATLDRRIVIYRRGEGPTKTVRLQAIGSPHDPRKDNCLAAGVETDIADLANVVICDGAHRELEVTLPLYRAWSEEDDELTASDLRESRAESAYNTGGKRDVWRLFVANEAADYSGTRTSVQPIPDGPGFLHPDVRTPRRRRIEDCLTLGPDGRRLPPMLEWTDGTREDPEDEESPLVWQRVSSGWQYHILDTQIGIRFSADTPPAAILAAGENAQLRITGTVVVDDRITATAERRSVSPNGREVRLRLDVADKFFFRARAVEEGVASVLDGEFDERDDTEALEAYARDVRRCEEAAGIRASIVVAGVDRSYAIGDLVASIDGRRISLNRLHPRAHERRFLQVTGLRCDRSTQTTTLLVEPADQLPFEPVAERAHRHAA